MESQYEELMDYNGDNLINLVNSFPEPYISEINGMSVATNISIKNFMLLNIFYEISTICSSIVAKDTNGKIFHARNLDFGLLLGWDFKNDVVKLLLENIRLKIKFFFFYRLG